MKKRFTGFSAMDKKTIDSVHTRTMKIVLSTMDPRLRASLRHGGQGVFLIFQSPIRRGGAPSGAAAIIVTDG